MEEAKKEETPKTENLNPITETSSIIDKADAVALRMEQANKRAEELLTRQEAIAARMMLSGRTEAGSTNKTKEQLQQEEVDKKVSEALKRYR